MVERRRGSQKWKVRTVENSTEKGRQRLKVRMVENGMEKSRMAEMKSDNRRDWYRKREDDIKRT